MSSTPTPPIDSPRGLTYAVTTYMMWGFLPIYMKALAHVPPVEVVAHRVLWSLPIAAAVLIWQRRSDQVIAALRTPRLLAMASLTATLISANWMIYVWAIGNGQTLEAALGYYINPLFSIFLGAVLLREKLSRGQMAAISLAGLAVLVLTIQAGSLPLVAIGLTLTWGFYAYCKRSLPLGPNQGFTLEVILLCPFAVGLIIWTITNGQGHFTESWTNALLLAGCGVVTAVPLLFYANAAKLVRLSTIAILQYISPTLIFICAIFLFNEPLDPVRLFAFGLIWLALILYTVSTLREAGARRRDNATRRMQ